MPVDDEYLCAAMNVSKNNISFENFEQASLAVLAKKYRGYALNLSVPNEAIISKTWVYPHDLLKVDIYQHIAKQAFSKSYASFDIEVLEENHDAKKQVILAHFLTHAHWKQLEETYIARGFKIHQLAPITQLKKHSIAEAWQHEALEDYKNFANASLAASAETCLKLLHRATVYERTFS